MMLFWFPKFKICVSSKTMVSLLQMPLSFFDAPEILKQIKLRIFKSI